MLDFLRLIGLFICLSHPSFALALEAEDDESPKVQPSSTASDDELKLPDANLQLAGIKTQILQAVQKHHEWVSQGSVL
ncbi:MAG: hypothetical protein RL563_1211, partial [Pseudomonadota bacterium]